MEKISFEEFVRTVDDARRKYAYGHPGDVSNSCVGVNCGRCPFGGSEAIVNCLAVEVDHPARGQVYTYARGQYMSKKLELI